MTGMFYRLLSALLVLGVAFIILPADADTTAEQGRAVFERFKDTVVTVRIVVGVSFGGQERESEQEANALMISPDGLAVLALSAIDPMQIMAGFRMSVDDMTTRIVSMRLVLSDGSEKPAELVLRDKDLDLAIIRLTEAPASALAHVSLDTVGEPEMFEEVVIIMQHGRVARRAHAAFIERIETLVERPRRFYAIGEHRSKELVCSPAFTLSGELVGMGVMRVISGAAEPSPDNIMVIIVPAGQIRDILDQVPDAADQVPDTTDETTPPEQDQS